MKKNYFAPETDILFVQPLSKLLSGSTTASNEAVGSDEDYTSSFIDE